MKKFDVIFIHPPRLLQQRIGFHGNLVRGAYIFIPMGVFAIADYLERNGFAVKLINYPLEQYLNPDWSLENYLRQVEFNIVAIDLHWIHNAFGAIEVSKMVKTVNPNAKVILGGFSASYYDQEILKYYRSIDGIIKGEGELPLLKYAHEFQNSNSWGSVPNLTYRTVSSHIKRNPITYVADTLDDLNFTNVSLLEHAREYFERSRKIMGISFNLPIGRGCPFNCPYCAGGQRAQQLLSGREMVTLRSPEKVVEDINFIADKYDIPSIFFGHGIYPATFKYFKTIFQLIQKEKHDIGADLEIWRLPFTQEMSKIFSKTFTKKDSSLSISPRTISSRVHEKISKICDPTFKFPLSQIKEVIDNSIKFQTDLRIWLTIGYPFQTIYDILKDIRFVLHCLVKYGGSRAKPITIMNESYYIFPGSPAHQAPEKFGVKLKYDSFPEILQAFKKTKISFFYNVLNYDKKYVSSHLIKISNLLFFISSSPLFLSMG